MFGISVNKIVCDSKMTITFVQMTKLSEYVRTNRTIMWNTYKKYVGIIKYGSFYYKSFLTNLSFTQINLLSHTKNTCVFYIKTWALGISNFVDNATTILHLGFNPNTDNSLIV